MRRRVNEKCPFGLRKGKIGDFSCRRKCEAYEGGSALFVQCGASETPTFECSIKVGDWVFSMESSERWLTFDGMANIVMNVDLKTERPFGP